MFSPKDRDLERGWPGRLDGDRIVQLAAQTLQAFFTGGGSAREHDVFAIEDVVLRAPVLRPGAVRVFDDGDVAFGNPASIYGPGEEVPLPVGAADVESQLRLAVVIGDDAIGGFTLVNDWLAPALPGMKAHDFGYSLGPVVVTPDEFDGGADWQELVDRAAANTRLYPGDVIAGPVVQRDGPFVAGAEVEVSLDGVGTLRNRVVA
jgi:Fumarylacetoacetate (FAA) hydrolase family